MKGKEIKRIIIKQNTNVILTEIQIFFDTWKHSSETFTVKLFVLRKLSQQPINTVPVFSWIILIFVHPFHQVFDAPIFFAHLFRERSGNLLCIHCYCCCVSNAVDWFLLLFYVELHSVQYENVSLIRACWSYHM